MSFPYPSTAIAGRESPPQSSPTILALKPCEYTRFMPGGFGSRLANARNLAPSQVFPLPTPRFISVLPDDGVSFIAERHSAISSDVASKIMPEHDTARGSYVSSYHNDGSISGDNRLPANSIPFTESWGGNGRAVRCPSESAPSEGSVESDQTVTQRVGRTISFGQFPPTMIPEKYRAPISVFSKSKVAPVVPQGARYRIFFLGPFRMIRTQCVEKRDTVPGMKELGDWLDAHMHEDLHQVVDVDAMLPEVIYTVKVPMLDETWLNYNQALAHFTNARNLHNILAVGKDDFEKVTMVHQDAAGHLTWPQLTKSDRTLEEMLTEMVEVYRLGLPWDWGRVGHRPELFPEERGGKLKGYPKP